MLYNPIEGTLYNNPGSANITCEFTTTEFAVFPTIAGLVVKLEVIAKLEVPDKDPVNWDAMMDPLLAEIAIEAIGTKGRPNEVEQGGATQPPEFAFRSKRQNGANSVPSNMATGLCLRSIALASNSSSFQRADSSLRTDRIPNQRTIRPGLRYGASTQTASPCNRGEQAAVRR